MRPEELADRLRVCQDFLRRARSIGSPKSVKPEEEPLILLIAKILETANACLFADLQSRPLPPWCFTEGRSSIAWPTTAEDVEAFLAEQPNR
jgi:hypothetical protein